MDQHLQDMLDALSEDEALDVYWHLRNRHDWTGTIFMHSDVKGLLEDQSELDEPLKPEEVRSLVETIAGDWPYRKLGDRLAEIGNQILAEHVSDVLGQMRTDADDATPYDPHGGQKHRYYEEN